MKLTDRARPGTCAGAVHAGQHLAQTGSKPVAVLRGSLHRPGPSRQLLQPQGRVSQGQAQGLGGQPAAHGASLSVGLAGHPLHEFLSTCLVTPKH